MLLNPILEKVLDPIANSASQLKDKVGEKIDNSDSNFLKNTKNVCKASISATQNAFSGIEEGSKEVFESVCDNSK